MGSGVCIHADAVIAHEHPPKRDQQGQLHNDDSGQMAYETGKRIVFSTHVMQEVERLCDRVLMLKAGVVVDEDSPSRLVSRYGRANLEEVFLDVARGRVEAAS